jgi:hypothetical protein
MRLTDAQIQKFWSKVKIRGIHACWEWQGGTQSKGYGSFGVNGKTYLAHKLSWMLANGRMPLPGLFVLHSCDNRKCVNPNHLREGTQLENVQDMWARGKPYVPPTKKKLTAEQVIAIRQMRGTQEQIAKRFGVHQTTVSQIVNRITWNS